MLSKTRGSIICAQNTVPKHCSSSDNPISSKCVSSTSVCTRVRDGHVEKSPGAAAAGALGSLNSSKKWIFIELFFSCFQLTLVEVFACGCILTLFWFSSFDLLRKELHNIKFDVMTSGVLIKVLVFIGVPSVDYMLIEIRSCKGRPLIISALLFWQFVTFNIIRLWSWQK